MITQEQDEVIQMIIEGKQIATIARMMNRSRQTIYSWLKLPNIKAELEIRQKNMKKEARDKINSYVFNCIDQIKDLAFNSSDQRVKLQALKYLLDHSLGTPTAMKESTIDVSEHNEDDINSLLKELDDIKKLNVIVGGK